jgi:hypothetical protein
MGYRSGQFCSLFPFICFISFSQEDVSYKLPPKEIADLLLVKPTPNVTVDAYGEWMLFTQSKAIHQ